MAGPGGISLAEVRSRLAKYYLATEAAGRPPTVSEFATVHLGIKRPTFYSRYPELVSEILARKDAVGAVSRGRVRDVRMNSLKGKLFDARRVAEELSAQNLRYANEIRRLSHENHELRRLLEEQSGVISIARGSEREQP